MTSTSATPMRPASSARRLKGRRPGRLRRLVRGLVDQPAEPGRTGPGTVDWILFGALVVGFAIEAILRTDLTWPIASFITAVVMAFATLWRRIYSAAMLWVAYSAAAILTIASANINGHISTTGVYSAAVPALLLPYALFRWGSGREILVGKIAMVAIWAICSFIVPAPLSETIGGLIVLILPCVLGWGVRAGVDARQRRVGEAAAVERERLARELHDTIAHHVSAIAIQAQAGRAQSALRPEAATEALDVIDREASRTLAEMRTIVRMLRRGGDHPYPIDDVAPLTLATVADLERLAPPQGVELAIRRSGVTDQLPPAVDHTIYRIVQESITNIGRHAPSATKVDVAVEVVGDIAVVDVVDNGGPALPPSGDGYGVLGMSERARLLGGTLSAGPTPTGWQVHGELPLVAVGQPVTP